MKEVKRISFLGDRNSEKKYVLKKLNKKIKHHLLIKKNSPTITKTRYLDDYRKTKMLGVYELNDDLISKNIPSFAMIYPFIELFLALAYLSESFLLISYSLTLIFMTSQSIGVFISLQKKEIIRCACMGSSINLDISSLTLIENLIMIFMASYMVLNFI